ncbi:hypothetical protein [uncultured Maritalea sp.]|jgi:hypothetical protein|uniref:hypothetical protein n=1 Tax=uncultured Maritalea sp. TaxID=757249 RepID=UPI0026125139|nr:hypothetical protein [uncultured Maritalea sp.]
MTRLSHIVNVAILALAFGAFSVLAGCSYDYAQRTDRVAHNAGNAVRANLEQSTTNPSSSAANSVGGLGKNGKVVPDAEE